MRENEKRDVFNQAIETLVARAVDQAKPKTPGAYAATTRADLRTRHYETARNIFDVRDVTAPELVDLLEPPSPPAPEDPAQSAAARLMAENAARLAELEELPRSAKAHAKERIAQIRNQLKGTA